jgi:hypothetical protein
MDGWDATDFMLIKLIVLGLVAFLWGAYTGFTGKPLDPREWPAADPKSPPVRPRKAVRRRLR